MLDGCSSDLGLLAEEYSPPHGRLAGNFPQAFSHLGDMGGADAVAHACHPLDEDDGWGDLDSFGRAAEAARSRVDP